MNKSPYLHVFLSMLLSALLFVLPGHAEDAPEITLPYHYTPEKCSFSLDLPTQPHIQNRCEALAPEQCYEIASFTKVYGPEASLRLDITCSPITEKTWQRYTPETMVATLHAMTDPTLITVREQFTDEGDTYKRATILGDGLQGQTPTLFIGELWLNHNAAFSVKAETVGNADQDTDRLLSSILRSISPTSTPDATDSSADQTAQ